MSLNDFVFNWGILTQTFGVIWFTFFVLILVLFFIGKPATGKNWGLLFLCSFLTALVVWFLMIFFTMIHLTLIERATDQVLYAIPPVYN